MRIGILSQWFDPEPGPAALPGVLARGLVQRGHEVQVVTGFPNYPSGKITGGYRQSRQFDEVLEGVRVRRVPLYPSHDGSTSKRLLNYGSFALSSLVSGIDAFRDVDVVWVNYSPVTIGVPMFAQRRLRGTPLVVHVLDLWPDTIFASGFAREGRLGGIAVRSLTRWTQAMYSAADTVAFISPGVGEVLASRGVPREKLAYAPMWADEEQFGPMPMPVDRGWGLGADDVALVYAGTLGGAQGLESLIEACARVDDARFSCLIAGSGVREDALRALAVQRGAKNVRFLGRLSPTEIGTLMAAGDVHYVGLNDHPLARVTMPSKIQSTLASARPIIGSLKGDAARIVSGSSGWVVDPGDIDGLENAIRTASAAGRSKLAHMGGAARRVYEAEFSQSVGIDRIESLLGVAAQRCAAS